MRISQRAPNFHHFCKDAPWCEIRRSHASFPGVKTHFASVAKERYQAAIDASRVSSDRSRPLPLVNGRSEPCQMVQVAEALAEARSISVAELADAAHANTMRLFFPRAM